MHFNDISGGQYLNYVDHALAAAFFPLIPIVHGSEIEWPPVDAMGVAAAAPLERSEPILPVDWTLLDGLNPSPETTSVSAKITGWDSCDDPLERLSLILSDGSDEYMASSDYFSDGESDSVVPNRHAIAQPSLLEDNTLRVPLSPASGAIRPARSNLNEVSTPRSRQQRASGPRRAGGTGPHRCTYAGCGKSYAKRSRLIAHERRHRGERPFACKEPGCGWGFSRADELARHARSHTGIKPYVCKSCGKGFGRSDHLKKHMKVHD